jgi:thioredoxin reductase
LGDTSVILSYRGDAFQRAKQRNRQRVDDASAKGQLKVLLNSQIREIRTDSVLLKQSGQDVKVANDAVIVSAGGILPNDFLRSIGIKVETKYGTA